MKHLGRILGVIAAVAALALYSKRNEIESWVTVRAFEWKLVNALKNVKEARFDDLVTKDVVLAALERRTDIARAYDSYRAREAFFDAHFCKPVYGEKHRDHGRCYGALYAVNAGTDWWVKKEGLSSVNAARVVEFRTVMMRRMREYLKNPDNLATFSAQHLEAAVRHVRSLPEDEKHHVVTWLKSVHDTFASFYEPHVQAAYQEVVKTERAWLDHERTPRHVAANGSIDWDKELRPFKEWQAAKEHLDNVSGNGDVALFAGRRHAEGGVALVATYATIVADFLRRVQ